MPDRAEIISWRFIKTFFAVIATSTKTFLSTKSGRVPAGCAVERTQAYEIYMELTVFIPGGLFVLSIHGFAGWGMAMNGILIRFGKAFAITVVFVFSPILFVFPHADASDKNIPASNAEMQRPLAELDQGVVTGQVVTVAGNTFFQYFVARWRDQPLSDRYSITVHERPSALRGNQIKIDFSNRTVFIATLPNSRGDLKNFAERAADITYQNTSEAEMQRLLFRDADLGADEL